MSPDAVPSAPSDLTPPQPAGHLANRQLLSADGRNYLVSSPNPANSNTQKYTFTAYDRQTGARVGAFQSPLAAVLFYVTDSKAVH
jgi:hypothetical protein